MGKSINRWELQDADIVVRPALAGMGSADFADKRRAIEAGRRAMQRLLPQLQAAIAAKSHEKQPGRSSLRSRAIGRHKKAPACEPGLRIPEPAKVSKGPEETT